MTSPDINLSVLRVSWSCTPLVSGSPYAFIIISSAGVPHWYPYPAFLRIFNMSFRAPQILILILHVYFSNMLSVLKWLSLDSMLMYPYALCLFEFVVLIFLSLLTHCYVSCLSTCLTIIPVYPLLIILMIILSWRDPGNDILMMLLCFCFFWHLLLVRNIVSLLKLGSLLDIYQKILMISHLLHTVMNTRVRFTNY